MPIYRKLFAGLTAIALLISVPGCLHNARRDVVLPRELDQKEDEDPVGRDNGEEVTVPVELHRFEGGQLRPGEARQHTVKVVSDPPGARAYLGGKYVGNTPLVVAVPDSPVTVTLVKEGYLWAQGKIFPTHPMYLSLQLPPVSVPSTSVVETAISKLGPPTIQHLERGVLRIGPFVSSPRIMVSPSGNRIAMSYVVGLEGFPRFWLNVASVVDLERGVSRIVAAGLGGILSESPYSYPAEGIRLAAWQDDEHLVLLTSRVRPGSTEPVKEDLAVEVAYLSGGNRRVITTFPHYLLGREIAGAWIPAGSQALFLHSYLQEGEIWRVDLQTGEKALVKAGIPISKLGGYPAIEVSPDGWKAVYGVYAPEAGLGMVDLRTGLDRKIAPEDGPSDLPKWSPDSKYVAFRVGEKGRPYRELEGEDGNCLLANAVWVVDTGGRRVSRLVIPDKHIGEYAWTGDSRHLVLAATSVEKDERKEWGWRLVVEGFYLASLEGDSRTITPGFPGEPMVLINQGAGWVTFGTWGA